MRLIKAWTGDPDRTYELFGKFQADEHGFVNDAYGMNRSESDHYMHTVEDMHHGRNLPSGHVPATKYILVNDDGKYVGISICGIVSTTGRATARGTSAMASTPNTAAAATQPKACA